MADQQQPLNAGGADSTDSGLRYGGYQAQPQGGYQIVIPPFKTLENGYQMALTPNPNNGASGQPRAVPHFSSTWNNAENVIRDPHFACFSWEQGANVPAHWFNGEHGWVTYYFTDVESYSRQEKKNGIHRCQVPTANGPCGWEIKNDSRCDGTPCWCPGSPAHNMQGHLAAAHGIQPPPKRPWATGLCETEGCFDVWCCAPCQGSRQLMALTGHGDTFNWGYCLFLCLLGCRIQQRSDGKATLQWYPPHLYAAMLTRVNVVKLQNIDEGICKSACTIVCCSACSLAQTYRELSVAGVWPGGTACSTTPPECAMVRQGGPAPPPVQGAMN